MKKLIFIGVVVVLSLVLAGCVTININEKREDGETEKIEKDGHEEVEELKDEGEKVDGQDMVVSEKSDEELIREAFAVKYNKNIEDVNLTISKKTATHAVGGVNFEGEMGGGWFLAAKTGGEWVIAADGNGTIPCGPVEQYNFPVDMAAECFDDTTGQLITR